MSEGAPLDRYVYAPARTRESLGTLISVHGVTRRAEEQFARWLPFAERMQLTLVAPCFGRDRFPGYQRLAGRNGGLPADPALLRLLDQLRDDGLVGVGPVFLFGYSGVRSLSTGFCWRIRMQPTARRWPRPAGTPSRTG
jgi:hypothetical protein